MITETQSAAERLRDAMPIAVAETRSADERWAAWQAKGAAHDRAVRRKMAIAAPILLVVVAVVMYALLGR
jgi:small-conductance mechanosensitive channel